MFQREAAWRFGPQSEASQTASPSDGSNRAVVKGVDLTLREILWVLCPGCGAAAGESCELHSGKIGEPVISP